MVRPAADDDQCATAPAGRRGVLPLAVMPGALHNPDLAKLGARKWNVNGPKGLAARSNHAMDKCWSVTG